MIIANLVKVGLHAFSNAGAGIIAEQLRVRFTSDNAKLLAKIAVMVTTTGVGFAMQEVANNAWDKQVDTVVEGGKAVKSLITKLKGSDTETEEVEEEETEEED